MDDWDRAVHFCRFSAVGRVGREDTVGERPNPVAFSLIADDRCVHGDATESDVGVGSEVVEPSRVLLGASLGGDDRDAVLVDCGPGLVVCDLVLVVLTLVVFDLFFVVEVDDRVASERASLGASGFEQGGGKDEAHAKASPGCPQQIWIELPSEIGRDESTQAGGGKGGIGAAEQAARVVWVDVFELRSHCGISLYNVGEGPGTVPVQSPRGAGQTAGVSFVIDCTRPCRP